MTQINAQIPAGESVNADGCSDSQIITDEEESDESEASESESEKDSGGLPGFGVLITLASFTMALLFIGLRNADE